MNKINVGVVGCDSMLDVDGRSVGKPASAAQSKQRWLEEMAGRSGVLRTGHWLVRPATGEQAVQEDRCRLGEDLRRGQGRGGRRRHRRAGRRPGLRGGQGRTDRRVHAPAGLETSRANRSRQTGHRWQGHRRRVRPGRDHCRRPGRRRPPRRAPQAAGRVKRKVAPPNSLLLALMCPPCRATIE